MKPQQPHALPDGWEMKRLGEIATNGTQNGLYKEPKFYGNGFEMVHMTDIFRSEEIVNSKMARVSISAKETEKFKLKVGDLLFARRSLALEGVAKCAIVGQLSEPVTFESSIIRVSLNEEKAFSKYIFYFLQSSKGAAEKIKLARQVAISGITGEDLKLLPIPLPPLPEQRRIAAVLGTWDRAIKQTTGLLTHLRTRHRGLMQRLLTGNVRLPGFAGEWKEYTYDELLREVKRPVRFSDEELYRLISVRRRSGGLFHRESLYGHQIMTKNLRTARNGDFLFSKMQIVHGASGLTTNAFDGMMISGSYIAVVSRDVDTLDIGYFNWLSQLPYFYHQTFVSSYGVHIEKMTFDFDAFLSLKTKIPPTIEEQRAIANVLDASLREIRQQESKLDALREQKRGLMQRLLTGQVRVPDRAEVD